MTRRSAVDVRHGRDREKLASWGVGFKLDGQLDDSIAYSAQVCPKCYNVAPRFAPEFEVCRECRGGEGAALASEIRTKYGRNGRMVGEPK